MEAPVRIKTISEFHQKRGLPGPAHPLVSVVNYENIVHNPELYYSSMVFDFYSICVKKNPYLKMRYGQQQYDFDEGVMFFMSPGQVFGISLPNNALRPQHTGWMLLIHPDFFKNTSLASVIKQYDYFSYAVNEALFLS